MPSHDLLPGTPAPETTGIAVVKSWGPPVQPLIVAAPGTGIIFISDTEASGNEVPIWELVSVTKNEVKLRCICRQDSCTRTATYRRTIKGHHPQR